MKPQTLLYLLLSITQSCLVHSFAPNNIVQRPPSSPPTTPTTTSLFSKSNEQIEEESRIKVLSDRRKTIRTVLRAADSQRRFRLQNGIVPKLDETTGEPLKSDTQAALSLTAFIVAGGAVALRIGGRAALVSALGLDFTQDPTLKDSLEQAMDFTNNMDTSLELGLFILAWTFVKVFCFDAGGIVLALASGVLFGGVWEGAILSAFAATVGSSVAFGMAKVDSPVRKKALEVVEENPSLRGIEKVVARDGLKAILTLRLAPVLPIPIGLYNYVYGVTNVPYFDFAGGIFLGSLKPYLLDSYLGVFGKQLVDGSAETAAGSTQDILLLVALGVSVLIGVFASQLANETWESINEEVEREKAEKGEDEDDKVMREFMGINLPQFVVGFQLSMKAADKRVNAMIEEEYHAKYWNYTEEELASRSDIIDPATYPNSPEVTGRGKGFDIAQDICNGLCLSPNLFGAYFRYADPLFDESKALAKRERSISKQTSEIKESNTSKVVYSSRIPSNAENSIETISADQSTNSDRQKVAEVSVDDLLSILQTLRAKVDAELKRY